MSLAQIIAAWAVVGGLRTRDAVESAMREAAAPTPERDFRRLIEMVRSAINTQVNAGKNDEHKQHVSLSAIYADRAVVELEDGRKYLYAYRLEAADGVEQVALAAPVEVVEQYVPTVATPAAAVQADVGTTFREAADGSIAVTLIRAGRSGNANYYPDTTLREAVHLFEGVRVFAKSDAEHIAGSGKDVRNLIGGVYEVRFV